jgi:diguanylate cyclase (GGDEF)-like protein
LQEDVSVPAIFGKITDSMDAGIQYNKNMNTSEEYMNKSEKEIELICTLIRQLNHRKPGEEADIKKAIAFLADSVNLGMLVGELQTVPTETMPNGYYEKTVFYTFEGGYDSERFRSISYKVIEPGVVTIHAYPRPGLSFLSDEVIDAIMELTYMNAERNFMIGKAERQAVIQPLTGLPNSLGFMREIRQKYMEGTITSYDSYYFNLNGYGLINRQFDQKEGDEVMKRYAGILKSSIAGDELVGHLGGDNYVALIHKGEHSENFQHLLEHVDTFAVKYGKKIPIVVTATAGMMPILKDTPPELVISGPSTACSFAKRTKVPIVILNDRLNEQISRAKIIEQRFEQALMNQEFIVYYQPKVNGETGELIGAEALCRWNENGKVVPPLQFIPVLEQSSRITELDLAMIELVCRDIAGWMKEGKRIYPVSVNLSRQDLQDPQLFKKIYDLIHSYEIPKDSLIIEITETTSEKEKKLMLSFLTQLQNEGIRISIDDFGSGYSSLGVLREMPVNEIKLDRSFINSSLDQKDQIIIQSIIEMSRKLNIDIIQEGVETEGQRDFIIELGCSRIQGFLYSQPLPKNLYEGWLITGRKPA